VGKEIKVRTSLKNFGNEKTFVEIIDSDNGRKDIELIKGKSSFKGEIQAGEEISLEFTYKLKNENTRLLPNAVAFYLNEFGEQEKIESNYPEITPLKEKALEPIIMLKKQINLFGEESEIEIIIINNSLKPVYNVEVELLPESELNIKEKKKEFEVIQPKEIVYFKTKVSSASQGKFSLGCKVVHENKKIECEETTIIFEEKGIDKKLVIGMALTAIGIILYSYLYLR
jgi:hypothetical protein